MDNDKNSRKFESVFSHKVRAGRRRTYFFDVRRTKGDDFYITLTESTKRFNGDGYERHKIFLYKEDFNRFMEGLEETVNYIKSDLLPDYDYDEYTRRNKEWEEGRENGEDDDDMDDDMDDAGDELSASQSRSSREENSDDDDMSW